jgi:hypothetical protein
MITLATSLPRYVVARVRSGAFITRPRVNLGIRPGAAPCAVRDIRVRKNRGRTVPQFADSRVGRGSADTANSWEPDVTNQRFLFD